MLAELRERHGGIKVPGAPRAALSKVFEIILWGELAAWKISAQLADRLVPLEAKMAATSQAHDEARHFYVMYDYLGELGYRPTRIDPRSQRVLDLVLETDNLAHKLLGMQLMIETTARTIFQEVRERRIEPVLADRLPYYEKDEARHVGLGTQHLPSLMRGMSRREGWAALRFQLRLLFWTLASLKAMEPDLAVLGIPASRLLHMGRDKQLAAFQEMWDGVGERPAVNDAIQRGLGAVEELVFTNGDTAGWRQKIARARAAFRGVPAGE
ncbi:MAG: ferritin-like domain-containing protein [Myxococcales bacterium]|nr:ferritin-like domain-containing protein [Myxococcales bacterium]